MDKNLIKEYIRNVMGGKDDDSMRSVTMLRQFISETITVAIEHSAEAGEPQKPLKIFTLDDDQGDEIEYFMRKYGTPKIEKDEKTKKRQELNKIARQDVVDFIIKPLDVGPENEQRLLDVIKPWGQDGIDALERILVTYERTGKKFPFFDYTAELGKTLKFPDAPSKQAINYVYNLTPRIGKNDTGRGELLLALMAGGIAGEAVGDLKIGDNYWEVKSIDDSAARLGDVTSKTFEQKLEQWWNSYAEKGSLGLVSFNELLAKLKSTEGVQELKEIEGEINRVLQESFDPALTGFAIVGDNEIMLLPPSDAVFSTHSGARRTHVQFNAIKAKKLRKQQDAALAKKREKDEKEERERREKEEKARKKAEERAQKAAKKKSP